MSRSLHHPRPPLGDCPFLPEGPLPYRTCVDRDCGVPDVDHPGGHCPDRRVAATSIREGDLVITRRIPVDYARRYYPDAWAAEVTADTRRTRRATAVRLNGLNGIKVDAAVDGWLDDPAPLPRRDPGIAWKVC